MSSRDVFWRVLAVSSLTGLGWSGHLLADTRERVARMEDEVVTVVNDCKQRGRCAYEVEP